MTEIKTRSWTRRYIIQVKEAVNMSQTKQMRWQHARAVWRRWQTLLAIILYWGTLASLGPNAAAQVDEGAITGVIQDSAGAVISGAQITLTNVDTGLILQTTSDGSGIYDFSPIKIGNFSVSATSPGFKTTSRQNIHIDVQQRLNVVLVLTPGSVSETVTVSTAPPLLQTQEGSVGQVVTTEAINDTPLNGRNWVYIAQLTAGVAPGNGSRATGTGDFQANGQQAEQNNYIIDGVDNNVETGDYSNGASFVVRPPPDALAEFKIETNSYSAEFGHSAGAVVNASLKSGTNQIHGDLWEYLRNNALTARDFNAISVPEYRENQFGATLGLPIILNKLFFFGDVEANRIISSVNQPKVAGNTALITVPTPLMRQGNFSELLSSGLTGQAQAIQLYQPNSGGTATLSCDGQNNVFCPNQIDPVALKILNLYPLPNTNNGLTYNNYISTANAIDNTWQWDTRLDYNISARDQTFARFSYRNEPVHYPSPLGSILDGGGIFTSGDQVSLGQTFAFSETHIFNPRLANEFRIGLSFGNYEFLQENYKANIAEQLGLGGIPFGPDNGGLPGVSITGTTGFGSPLYYVTDEHQNLLQIMDNVTKTVGNHSLKFGVDFQSIRFSTLQPYASRGTYTYSGLYTSKLGASFTGYGMADFLTNQMHSASLSSSAKIGDVRWYRSGYVEDDWRITRALTVNLGLRYDFYQPYRENGGSQANFNVSQVGVGTGAAVYLIPRIKKNVPLVPAFTNLASKDNISIQYDTNPSLVIAQKYNFAPRLGFAYQVDPRSVVRAGFGMFYGGLQAGGSGNNLGSNYPFYLQDSFLAPNCTAASCPSNGLTLETGFSEALSVGLQNFISTPSMKGTDLVAKTPYVMEYNLTVERAFTDSLVATLSYVGNVGRHIGVLYNGNSPAALVNPAINSQKYAPFPDFGSTTNIPYAGVSDYNSMQAKVQKRLTNGLSFLATYTWAHSMDDTRTLLGRSGDSNYRNINLIPIREDYANSQWDVQNRVTFNGSYQLPFGIGRAHLNRAGASNLLLGGWATSLTFVDQDGSPFSVSPNITTAAGGSANAIPVRNPFGAGGSPDPSNPKITCAAKTKTKANWFNPCAFANPLPGSMISAGSPAEGSTPAVAPQLITDRAQVLAYLGGRRNEIRGPGYERVNMSLFKNFLVFREQSLQLRADIFNLLNTPSYGTPTATINSNGGQITSPQTFQNFTPDARFFQLSLKYVF